MPLPLIISFDGNIGSGKSTTCEEYEEYLKNGIKKSLGEDSPFFPNITSFEEEICFLDEPVALWNQVCDENGVNILTNLYKDIRANAFKFQMMAYISRLSLLRKAVKDPKIKLIITERSVETDRNVFAKMLYDAGDISHDEFQIYTLWFDEFLTDVPLGGSYIFTLHQMYVWNVFTNGRVLENQSNRIILSGAINTTKIGFAEGTVRFLNCLRMKIWIKARR